MVWLNHAVHYITQQVDPGSFRDSVQSCTVSQSTECPYAVQEASWGSTRVWKGICSGPVLCKTYYGVQAQGSMASERL